MMIYTRFKTLLLFSTALLMASPLLAQKSSEVTQEAFLPFKTGPSTQYRSASGAPGVAYWQNSADYEMDVHLNPDEHKVSSSVTIYYTNNSPQALDFIWLKLDQNLFAEESWGAKLTPYTGSRFGNKAFGGGLTIEKISVQQDGKTYRPDHRLLDTNMKVDLQQAMPSDGGEIAITIDYSFVIPEYGSDRLGRQKTKKGVIYEIAQWYPRVAVFDDIQGWNTLPYLGAGEFYMEYGDFEYNITAPSEYIVLGSGQLENADEVLTDEQQQRLEKARDSDERVFIITKEEVGTDQARPQGQDQLTWKFKIENSRDIAWTASKAFIWDAARINLPDGDQSLAMSVYPEESAGDSAWGRSTEYVKGSVEYYSKTLMKYPYENAINVAGTVAGMEYPGIVFCSWKATEGGLWGVTNHEFGHTWFPMIVGSNEREHVWMDEGFNSFFNSLATKHFNDGEYYRETDARILNGWMTSPVAEPIMTAPDQIQPGNLGAVAYNKPALGLKILRNSILGEEVFDEVFSEYIDRWAYKHPMPNDFFNTVENVSGRNLDWFWRGWFQKGWTMDQAVDSVSYVEDDPAKGALISLSNNDKLVMPVVLEITLEDGTSEIVKLPVQVWHRGNNWIMKYDSDIPLRKVQLDPRKEFPDVDPNNNLWTAEPVKQ